MPPFAPLSSGVSLLLDELEALRERPVDLELGLALMWLTAPEGRHAAGILLKSSFSGATGDASPLAAQCDDGGVMGEKHGVGGEGGATHLGPWAASLRAQNAETSSESSRSVMVKGDGALFPAACSSARAVGLRVLLRPSSRRRGREERLALRLRLRRRKSETTSPTVELVLLVEGAIGSIRGSKRNAAPRSATVAM